ncbi:hypothetical protein HanXRQr2_Chr02g0065521 [Helianthus annuus]|uniref:Uncharacterized protein n=1 Tax=Helianthus annuus TaxID=4232 RepID=A0A251VHH9_HELAN|nr:hypothetical protein HanXRQr2_Chr02g0065521 [Helianthus annuus]
MSNGGLNKPRELSNLTFHSVLSIKYYTQGLEIGCLSPYQSSWFSSESSVTNKAHMLTKSGNLYMKM